MSRKRARLGSPSAAIPYDPSDSEACAAWQADPEAWWMRAAGEAAYHAASLRDTPAWYRAGGGVVDPSGDVRVMGRIDDPAALDGVRAALLRKGPHA